MMIISSQHSSAALDVITEFSTTGHHSSTASVSLVPALYPLQMIRECLRELSCYLLSAIIPIWSGLEQSGAEWSRVEQW